MNLKPISLNEDKTNEAYASTDCQQLLQMYDDFYPKIGFNIPWIGYFVVRQDKIVGSCSFVGQPCNVPGRSGSQWGDATGK